MENIMESTVYERLAALEVLAERTAQDVTEIKHCLLGNGHPGLRVEVDRLKQTDLKRCQWLKMIGTAVLALCVKLVYDITR